MFEERFRSLCDNASAEIELLGTDFKANKKFAVFTMFRRQIKLELVFKRSSFGNVDNVLYCRVYPSKSSDVYYLLPEVFVELDIEDFRSTFFSMIENEDRLKLCFDCLWSIIVQHLPKIEKAAATELLPVERNVSDDDTWERKAIFAANPLYDREPFVILDYTKGNAYRALLNGNTEKAVKLLEKGKAKGKTLEYQNRLCAFLRSNGGEFSVMPDECNAVKNDDSAEKASFSLYTCILFASFAFTSLLLFAAKLIFDLFFYKGTVAVFGAPWYACFLLAALPAMIGAVLFRKKLMKLLFPKRAGAMIERDTVKNTPITDKLAGIMFAASVGFVIAVFIMISLSAVRVYGDRLDAASKSSVFKREEYLFAEIGEICHISARYNEYGERVERGSYVILLKSGRMLDLDSAMTEKQTEDELLPMLEELSIPIVELDSDRDLAGRK